VRDDPRQDGAEERGLQVGEDGGVGRGAQGDDLRNGDRPCPGGPVQGNQYRPGTDAGQALNECFQAAACAGRARAAGPVKPG
jgi:hypothetical protein